MISEQKLIIQPFSSVLVLCYLSTRGLDYMKFPFGNLIVKQTVCLIPMLKLTEV